MQSKELNSSAIVSQMGGYREYSAGGMNSGRSVSTMPRRLPEGIDMLIS